MSAEKSGFPESTKDTTGDTTSQSRKGQRLESLLVDDTDIPPVGHLAGREVKVVDQVKRNLPGQILLILLASLLVVGIGLWIVNFLPLSVQQNRTEIQSVEQRLPVPPRTPQEPSVVVADVQEGTGSTADEVLPATAQQTQLPSAVLPVSEPNKIVSEQLYSVRIGPLMSKDEMQQAKEVLERLGLPFQRTSGRGLVTMTRLREGIYPEPMAQKRLNEVKKISKEAFLLPQGAEKALYVGSFHEEFKALEFQQELAQKQLKVTPVKVELTMEGPCLVALQADIQTAQQVAAHLQTYGWGIQLIDSE